MNVISEKEYSFSNALFWNVMLHHHIQAFDEERDVNFDEVWDEELAPALLDEKRYKEYWGWLSQIELETSENQGEIERIRIKTLGNKTKYIQALPLHHSQQEVERTAEYSIFEYLLRPTYDFCQELLSHGSDLEVLSPQPLREQIKSIVKNMEQFYG